MRKAKNPPRFGEGGTGSISYVFSNLVAEILDFKVKHVTGYGSAREIDLGLERGEADCRATSDITLVRPPWPTWVQQGYIAFVIQQGPAKSRVLPETVPTIHELAPASAKATLRSHGDHGRLHRFRSALCDFARRAAGKLQLLRDGFEKMLTDASFMAEAKKLVDWDGASYFSGADLAEKNRENRHPAARCH